MKKHTPSRCGFNGVGNGDKEVKNGLNRPTQADYHQPSSQLTIFLHFDDLILSRRRCHSHLCYDTYDALRQWCYTGRLRCFELGPVARSLVQVHETRSQGGGTRRAAATLEGSQFSLTADVN